jgi:hypothetical protein
MNHEWMRLHRIFQQSFECGTQEDNGTDADCDCWSNCLTQRTRRAQRWKDGGSIRGLVVDCWAVATFGIRARNQMFECGTQEENGTENGLPHAKGATDGKVGGRGIQSGLELGRLGSVSRMELRNRTERNVAAGLHALRKVALEAKVTVKGDKGFRVPDSSSCLVRILVLGPIENGARKRAAYIPITWRPLRTLREAIETHQKGFNSDPFRFLPEFHIQNGSLPINPLPPSHHFASFADFD